MSDKIKCLPEPLALLEQLRARTTLIEELQRRIATLEQALQACRRAEDSMARDRALNRELKSEGEWFFDHSLDMLGIAETDGRLKRVNPAFERVLGYTSEELVGRQLMEFIHPDDHQRAYSELESLGSGNDSVNFEVRCRSKDGRWRWISLTCPAAVSTERGLYAIGRDVTERKATEAELLYRSQHDALTALPNRATFDQTLAQAIARAIRHPQYQVGLLLIDLDGFKAINDSHGHAAGDAVLQTVGARLLACQRKNEFACRLGGDEFALIVEGVAPLSLDPLARRIIDLLGQPIPFDAASLTIGCSIGIALYSLSDEDVDSLYQRADGAMYAVKKAGKNGYGYD
ncbi:diguanylate cyclase domain-containing protein [Rugamonas apoptosis]|uniref:Diguanylate cyclase n=1 Tax=Rugamonas apoptosis TaxID=2758570 RepID=A0A7W2FDV8_9BURK|nr:diguanylate cyclase [Rugamonas apoptosis]MBA5689871.1 diguanylate cyclase [Rugamonas apoptosis]